MEGAADGRALEQLEKTGKSGGKIMSFLAETLGRESRTQETPVSPEAAAYIDRRYLALCRNRNDPAFCGAIRRLCVAHGYTSLEAERIRDREAYKEAAELAQRQAALVGGASTELVVPEKYRGVGYDREYWPALGNAIDRVLAHGLPLRSMYIHGRSHTGKSHGAAVLAMEYARLGKRVAWVNCPRLRNLYEDGITSKETKRLAVCIKQEAIEAELLVLDDIGKDDTGTSSGDARTLSYFGRALYEIVEERQGKGGRVTLCTSEYAPSDPRLAERLTEALVNRIVDKSAVIGDAPKMRYPLWRERAKNPMLFGEMG